MASKEFARPHTKVKIASTLSQSLAMNMTQDICYKHIYVYQFQTVCNDDVIMLHAGVDGAGMGGLGMDMWPIGGSIM